MGRGLSGNSFEWGVGRSEVHEFTVARDGFASYDMARCCREICGPVEPFWNRAE